MFSAASRIARWAPTAVQRRWQSTAANAGTFDKILVANRGEIACRVMETAKRMGVRCVAVYSEADANAKHVQLADEAYCLGPPPAAQSYLLGDSILNIAQSCGAQAVHPGYGFLSENEGFATACGTAGVTFIGPPAAAIRDMGSKSASKDIMIAAGVPVTPGYHGEDQSFEVLEAEADAIGYPVLIKAVLGGGGKGMRVVMHRDELSDMLKACKREARASFGDDRVLVEKYLIDPRHVEVQVFADTHGDAVYLFERDCSVQRRHQKVLEEAPAPDMDPALRKQMGESAVAAAKAVGYVGAGTVEFIFGQDNSFYFMEMNTRLQVEHPVTEAITGQDLVEWQLKVAAGHPLPLKQEDLKIQGHALEARVYAESPTNNFLPQTGKIVHLRAPPTGPNVRVDTGVREGDEVSIFYDPMISKLITIGEDREAALRHMVRALEQYQVVGVRTNLDFLRTCVMHPAFQAGGVDTGFIEKHMDALMPVEEAAPAAVQILAALGTVLEADADGQEAAFDSADPTSPWHSGAGVGAALFLNHNVTLNTGGVESPITITRTGTDAFKVNVDGTDFAVTASTRSDGKLVAEIDSTQFAATVVNHDGEVHVFTDGHPDAPYHRLDVVQPDFAAAGPGGKRPTVITPMPGKVIQMNVKAGQEVKEGDALMIIEAMKMEHVIRAPVDGVLESVNCAEEDFVEDGKVLVVFGGED